jgi:hypothetical protein
MSSGTTFACQAISAVAFGMIGAGGRGRYMGGLAAKDPRVRVAANL